MGESRTWLGASVAHEKEEGQFEMLQPGTTQSVFKAGAPYAHAIVAAAGPRSNPVLGGPLLHAIPPLSASTFPVSLDYIIIQRQKVQKYA